MRGFLLLIVVSCWVCAADPETSVPVAITSLSDEIVPEQEALAEVSPTEQGVYLRAQGPGGDSTWTLASGKTAKQALKTRLDQNRLENWVKNNLRSSRPSAVEIDSIMGQINQEENEDEHQMEEIDMALIELPETEESSAGYFEGLLFELREAGEKGSDLRSETSEDPAEDGKSAAMKELMEATGVLDDEPVKLIPSPGSAPFHASPTPFPWHDTNEIKTVPSNEDFLSKFKRDEQSAITGSKTSQQAQKKADAPLHSEQPLHSEIDGAAAAASTHEHEPLSLPSWLQEPHGGQQPRKTADAATNESQQAQKKADRHPKKKKTSNKKNEQQHQLIAKSITHFSKVKCKTLIDEFRAHQSGSSDMPTDKQLRALGYGKDVDEWHRQCEDKLGTLQEVVTAEEATPMVAVGTDAAFPHNRQGDIQALSKLIHELMASFESGCTTGKVLMEQLGRTRFEQLTGLSHMECSKGEYDLKSVTQGAHMMAVRRSHFMTMVHRLTTLTMGGDIRPEVAPPAPIEIHVSPMVSPSPGPPAKKVAAPTQKVAPPAKTISPPAANMVPIPLKVISHKTMPSMGLEVRHKLTAHHHSGPPIVDHMKRTMHPHNGASVKVDATITVTDHHSKPEWGNPVPSGARESAAAHQKRKKSHPAITAKQAMAELQEVVQTEERNVRLMVASMQDSPPGKAAKAGGVLKAVRTKPASAMSP